MKTIAVVVMLSFNAGLALAQDSPLVCWYNERAAYTGADSAPATTLIRNVERTGQSGDRAYSYAISARDGDACPNELPLGMKTAVTVPLVPQDNTSCTNDDVRPNELAATGGSVTVFRRSNGATEVLAHLTGGTTPNTTYEFYLKCVRKLGTIRTDGNGHGDGCFEFPPDTTGSTFAFDMYPDRASAGSRYQSVLVTHN